MARPFFTYLLLCSDKLYYVGHTDDLERRVAQHQTGATGGYTATRRPIQLVWSEEFSTRQEAKAVEAQIKKWSRRKKKALIAGRIDELRLAARKDWDAYRQRRSLDTAPVEPTQGSRIVSGSPNSDLLRSRIGGGRQSRNKRNTINTLTVLASHRGDCLLHQKRRGYKLRQLIPWELALWA